MPQLNSFKEDVVWIVRVLGVKNRSLVVSVRDGVCVVGRYFVTGK